MRRARGERAAVLWTAAVRQLAKVSPPALGMFFDTMIGFLENEPMIGFNGKGGSFETPSTRIVS
jgi:hypothetical protein